MKRSPLRRATPKAVEWQRRKRTVLARVGKRGRVRRAEWEKAKAEHLAKRPICEFESVVAVRAFEKPFEEMVEWSRQFDFTCRGPLDVHHVIPRGMGGGKDYGVYATLCRGHHSWVEEHRQLAREMGLLLRPRDVENEG